MKREKEYDFRFFTGVFWGVVGSSILIGVGYLIVMAAVVIFK